MTAPLLRVRECQQALRRLCRAGQIDLDVAPGERLGLIGPNGSGKSTLVNCMCGTLHHETGEVFFGGRSVNGLLAHERTRLGMARSFQLPRPFASLSVADNLRVPLLYTGLARSGASRPRPNSTRAATICSASSRSRTRRANCRAT